jgi:hypothetical protein
MQQGKIGGKMASLFFCLCVSVLVSVALAPNRAAMLLLLSGGGGG